MTSLEVHSMLVKYTLGVSVGCFRRCLFCRQQTGARPTPLQIKVSDGVEPRRDKRERGKMSMCIAISLLLKKMSWQLYLWTSDTFFFSHSKQTHSSSSPWYSQAFSIELLLHPWSFLFYDFWNFNWAATGFSGFLPYR